jgi:RNA polymerase sigma-70 factor (ECF subfamily)
MGFPERWNIHEMFAPVACSPTSVRARWRSKTAGLALIQDPNKERELAGCQWLYSAQADLHRRLRQAPEAQAAYRKALSMSQQEPERRYLERRLQELEKK